LGETGKGVFYNRKPGWEYLNKEWGKKYKVKAFPYRGRSTM
jgi:hypothetical protein